ncbi:methyltransferase domain-containing protein [Paracoccus salsus]|uniref:methyltransferase domain-containing protein n=1 Tax=Paracoccus salsus TaxID=2911061 RepID=UPI001F4361B7|nr:methyltransferase domain-containing protein [Paracoccus salsus]MCF3975065.1 methyltransferase domain-containing protein [Paracoccus salsus]
MTSWLHEERLQTVHALVLATGASRVLDLGCGDGDLLVRLACDDRFETLLGVDLCASSLDRLRRRLDGVAMRAGRVELRHGSMTEPAADMTGFDCAVLIETIEHVDPCRLSRLECALFREMRPLTVVITTPNADFNPLLGVPSHRFRHPDHRFEWSRWRFRKWARRAAGDAGYEVEFRDIGGSHPELGGASQLGVFRLAGIVSGTDTA